MTRDDDLLRAYHSAAPNGGYLLAGLRAVAAAAAAAEREACAKVCEETTAAWTQPVYNGACMDCAVAIRARGEK